MASVSSCLCSFAERNLSNFASRPVYFRVDLEEVGYTDAEYDPNVGLHLASVYPIVQGYRGGVAAGVRLDFSDPIFLHEWAVTLSASIRRYRSIW